MSAAPPSEAPGDGPGPEGLPFDRRYSWGGRYAPLRAEGRADPEAFWAGIARRELLWERPFTRTLGGTPPEYRWFEGGELNAAANCLLRHAGTPVAQKVAYYWEGEEGSRRTLSYADLEREVRALAGALAARGFTSEDRAAIYLPMVPELPIAMLALALLGIPFTVVFSGFAAEALAHRLTDLGARLLLTAESGRRRGATIPLLETARAAAAQCPGLELTVVLGRGAGSALQEGKEVGWTELVRELHPPATLAVVPSNHPLFLLYSSGTTGSPKGIVHGTAGYLTQLAATVRWVFDPAPTDVLWCAADVGWVTGHSYIVFGPLLAGATSVLYEGALDVPSAERFYEIVERYRVSLLYTSPTALRSLRRAGEELPSRHDLSSLRLLGSVGESINPSVWEWYFRRVGGGRCPIVDTWWQTETGGIMVSPTPSLDSRPLKPGSATLPVPGVEVAVLREDGRECAVGERGYAAILRPWPGMLLGLWKDPERYRSTYWTRFPGAYYTGDYAVRDPDGYLWFLGRADEVLKIAGHRIGTIEVEDALLHHPAVAEAAVCGAPDEVKGEVPVAVVVLRAGVESSPGLPKELAEYVSARIGKFACPQRVLIVAKLPRTRSGKIMRRVVRAVVVARASPGDVSTLEDEASVEEVRHAADALAGELGPPPGGHPP
ncbi:MAG TPA: acetate--CoA ligase [Thermoplasmata archaeon]|nr:acetate--CoA ligase [Thermoplasmata archaeon]